MMEKLITSMEEVASFEVCIDERVDALNLIKEVLIKDHPLSPTNVCNIVGWTDDQLYEILDSILINLIRDPNLCEYINELLINIIQSNAQLTKTERNELWRVYDKILNRLLIEYREVFNCYIQKSEYYNELPQPHPPRQYKSWESVCNKVLNDISKPKMFVLCNKLPPHFPDGLENSFKFVECENHTHDRGTCDLIKKLTSLEPEHNTNQGGDHHGFN